MRVLRNILVMLFALSASTSFILAIIAAYRFVRHATYDGFTMPSYVVITTIITLGLAVLYYASSRLTKE